MKLRNDRHEEFCQQFIIDMNATRAAKDSGFSEKTAYSQGQRLLKNVEIQKRIAELQQERAEKTEVTQNMVIKELAIIAFSDLKDYIEVIEDTGAIRAKSFEEMPEGKSRALQSIKEDRVIKESADGKQVTVYDKINFRLHDKIKALELLGKHLGMFTDIKLGADDTLKAILERIITEENPNGKK